MNEEKTIHISPPRRIEVAAAAALLLLAAYLAVGTIQELNTLGHPTTPPANTITVSGTGQVSLAPDIAHITFSVMHTAATAADAQTATSKQANAAIQFVKGQGIADKDITTLSYNVSPQYSYPSSPCPPGAMCPVYNGGGSPKITGYQVSETIQVTVRNLDSVSGLLQGLGQQNVQNINGPEFALESPTAGTDAARAKAIDNARQQAELLAKQLGVELGRITSFSENGGGYPVYGYGAAVKSADSGVAPAPNIPQGENTYTSSVTITYEIN